MMTMYQTSGGGGMGFGGARDKEFQSLTKATESGKMKENPRLSYKIVNTH
jgi:hypothetical protein